MSCCREFVRLLCFCVVHRVSVYWHTNFPDGSVDDGVGVSFDLSMRERFCSSCSRWSMQSNPSGGCPSLASIHCHKLFISLVCMPKFAWLLGRRSPRHPSASDPLKAIVVSNCLCFHCHCLGLYPHLWYILCQKHALCLCLCVLFLHGKWS